MKTEGLEVEGFDTVKYKDFNSRKEIEKYIKKQQEFLDRKANFGVMNNKGVMLEYDLVRELEKKTNKVNKAKADQFDEIKKLPFTHRGKQVQNLTVGDMADPKIGMGDSRYSDFKGLKFNPHRFESNAELKKRLRDMEGLYEKQDYMTLKNQQLKKNYLKGMDEAGLTQLKSGRTIAKRILEMDLDEFVKQFYSENNASIAFLYDKDTAKARVRELQKVWKKPKKKKGA